MCKISIETSGRRHYIVGNTYSIKDQLRSAGCHWDGDRKAWWTGHLDVAMKFAGKSDESEAPSRPEGDTLTEDSKIAGKATYKGKQYILVWEGETKRGRACKLAFADGSKVFWAEASEVQISKRYEAREYRGRVEHMTFGRLQRLRSEYAETRKSGVDTSYRAYKEEIEAMEDNDSFGEVKRLEQMGYAAWKSEVLAGAKGSR